MWRPLVRRAGLPEGVGFHQLRHFYASLLIRHGESVKTVQLRLGHASAAETLNTYSHLWPDSDDRTREAVDLVLGPATEASAARGRLNLMCPRCVRRAASITVSPGQSVDWWRVGLYAGFCTGPCGPVMAIPLG